MGKIIRDAVKLVKKELAQPVEVLGPVESDDDEPIVETELLEDETPARRKPTIVVRSNAISCPYCHETVDASRKNWVACSSCLARHHKACWRENKKCATCATRKHLVNPGEAKSRGRVRAATPRGPRLLSSEANVKAIAFWNCLTGALLSLLGIFMMLAGSQVAAVGIIGFIIFVLAAGLFAAGVALFGFVPWARTATIVINAIGLVLAPISALNTGGSMLGVVVNVGWSLAIIAALSAAGPIFHPAYHAVIQNDRGRKANWLASPFFWVPIGIFVLEIGLAISQPAYSHRGW